MLKVCKSICIVGNGGSLKDKFLGDKIDQHDVIVRCNMFEITGYEKDVGSRTTHWLLSNFFTTLPGITSRRDCSLFKEVWVSKFKEYSDILYNVRSLQFIDSSIITEPIKAPTTGLMGVFYAISKFKHVNIVGFGISEKMAKSHYDVNRNHSWTGHDLDAERLLLNKLIAQGVVRRLDEGN